MPLTTVYEVKTFADIVAAVREELGIQSTDTTMINRIKRDINAVYREEVLPFKEWSWLRGKVTLTTLPFYTGSDAIVETGFAEVDFSTTVPSVNLTGYYFSIAPYSEVYRIKYHTNAANPQIFLETPYIGSSDTAASWKIWTDKIPLPTDCRETIQVRSNWRETPLDNVGIKTFREYFANFPQAENRPDIYTTGDYIDPEPYVAISGIPDSQSISSDGFTKSITFEDDVSGYLRVGDRIRVTDADSSTGHEGTFIVSELSTNANPNDTISYTGLIQSEVSNQTASSVNVTKLQSRADARAYRELWYYPAMYSTPSILDVDYAKNTPPLIEDTDEPIIPLHDRFVLVYGALARGWPKQRNPEEGKRNEALFGRKLGLMAGRMTDSVDMPVLQVSKATLATKRAQRRASACWWRWW